VPGAEVFLFGADADVVVEATAASMNEHDRSAWGYDVKEGGKLGAVVRMLGEDRGRRYVLAQPRFLANQRACKKYTIVLRFHSTHQSSLVVQGTQLRLRTVNP